MVEPTPSPKSSWYPHMQRRPVIGDTVGFLRPFAKHRTYGRVLALIENIGPELLIRVLPEGSDRTVELPRSAVEIYDPNKQRAKRST